MKNNRHMIALAIAAAASLPWQFMNRAAAGDAADGNWYRINNLEDTDKTLEMEIYGEIGAWGVSAQDFIRDLKAADDGKRQIVVAINSVGGEIGDGFAIHNALQRLGDRVTARIDGWALSAAGIIAAGAKTVWMHDNAMLMMHNPWTFAAGDSDDFRKVADVMDQLVEGIIASFKHRPLTVDDAELRRMINAETWLTAEEAKELGFVDLVLSGDASVSNMGNVRIFNRYRNIPDAVKAQLDAEPDPEPPEPDPAPEPPAKDDPSEDDQEPEQIAAALAIELIAACTKEGIGNFAPHIIKASGLKSQADVQREITRAKNIRDLCAAARIPEKAEGFVSMGLTEDQSRARLFDALAGSGFGEIDNKGPTDNPAPAANTRAVNPGDIYAKRKNNAAKGAA